MRNGGWTGDRFAGAALVGAGLLVLLAMGHHPSSAHDGGLATFIHAAMILLSGLLAFGFGHFAVRRGVDRPLILAGLVAYGIGLVGNVAAATINGFVVPALARRGEAVGHDVFILAWEANQALAANAVYAVGTAFAFWGLDLILSAERRGRILGAAGLISGIVTIGLLASGTIRMNVAGAFLIYGIQAGWGVLVGVYLLRREDRVEAENP